MVLRIVASIAFFGLIVYSQSKDMKLHYGDLTDSTCLVKIINEVKPTEIYNLGAQSHVKVSSFCCFPFEWFVTCVTVTDF